MAEGPFVHTRRRFIGTSAAVAAALSTGIEKLFAEEQDQTLARLKNARPVNLGIIGSGGEGRWLMTNLLKSNIPGVQFKAVCDIWPHSRQFALNILKEFKQPEPRQYVEYAEFLEKEKDIEAVIVAVPDWLHAVVSNDCLRAGKHVYCEKEMDKTIEGARSMLQTARETKKILHVGHQRHASPLYKLAYDLLHKEKVCGRVTHARGQFNRNWAGRRPVDPNENFDCTKWGYATMAHLRDWRLYKKHGGGWMADLGSHQVDVFNWMFDGPPSALMASGGIDYYIDEKDSFGNPYPPREWYDNVLAILEYPDRTDASGKSRIRVQYQVITTNAFDGFYEQIMGTDGTLFMSSEGGGLFREPNRPKLTWEMEAVKSKAAGKEAITVAVGRSLRPGGALDMLRKRDNPIKFSELSKVELPLDKGEHQYSVESFIDSVLTGKPPACSPEEGYAVTVVCVKASEAAESGQKVHFKPDDFNV
jgi:predicted dehydrogenase